MADRFKHGPNVNIWDLTVGSFAIADEMRPRVIDLDFPALPAGAGRSQRLIENGTALD